jgi:hypothetical protein
MAAAPFTATAIGLGPTSPASFFGGLMIVAALGCAAADRPADLPPLVKCAVQVMQDGAPLQGAQVLLISATSKWSVGGMTDETGVAEMFTHGKFAGAPAGEYKVTVVKEIVEEVPNPRHVPEKDNEPTLTKITKPVDPKFGQAKTTPLELSVAADGGLTHSVDVGPAVVGNAP